MKKLLILFTCAGAMAQLAYLLPEKSPWKLRWEQDKFEPDYEFTILSGTNVVKSISTNDYSVLSITNGIATIESAVEGLEKGTSAITMVAKNALGQASPASSNLTLRVLGKPLAPQGLRKP